ncbi:hypothetical protein EHQ12_04040 [Leptospira gomenensis]|uniref:Uncharacterized protein n=1 Tax=Leptospira gomenensis TaxID=2484974 RepID=A0A5F1YI64_9LEPT|nr:hypothetical protein [Leptospira gomenensis]TGK36212.1 hypothetical protein EHQ17_04680 [Leptospira gomenensis]TGK42750.1 hypothetical protein EHQ07_13820 [Leptospira gomenensis]TGK42937.1 hypothetical protein EHQ12_04040 [Leptospira gomenensis]TGK54949.1 hypothetical protein EHQ13_18295 [Leptospira gomenensis]
MTKKIKKFADEFRTPSLAIFSASFLIEAGLQFTEKAKELSVLDLHYTVFGAIAILSLLAYLRKPITQAWVTFRTGKTVPEETKDEQNS